MRRLGMLLLALILLAGCGSKRDKGGTVKGTITYNGKAVNGVTLHFYPLPGPGDGIPIAVTQEGSFTASNIPPGDYKIVVEAPPDPAKMRNMPQMPKGLDAAKQAEMKKNFEQQFGQATIPFPNKYKAAASTDLKCTIKEGQQNLSLELKDK
jgi:hypothetical protein